MVENVNDEACSSFLFTYSFHWSCTLHVMHNIYHKYPICKEKGGGTENRRLKHRV